MADVATVFGLSALIIFIGFLGTLFFQRTKVPDILILIFVGVFLGPISGILDTASLAQVAELFGSLALTLILFDGGLDMKYREVVKKFGSVLVLLGFSFAISTISIAIVYQFFFPGSPVVLSLALGAMLSAVSAPIVIPLLSVMSVKSETKALLDMESALTDAAAIIVVFALLGFLGGTGGNPGQILIGLGTTVVFSTVIALLLGIAWLEVLQLMKGRAYSYVVTIAIVLGLYSVTEFLGGAGPVAALVFGIVLSNAKEMSARLPIRTEFVLDERIRWFHAEMTFFLKTFFFVYVGVIFQANNLNPLLMGLSFILLGLIAAARWASVRYLVVLKPEEREDHDVLTIMLPRGLTSVVLATVVAATVTTAGATFLADVAFTVVVLSNIVVTIGVFAIERRRMKEGQIPPSELEALA